MKYINGEFYVEVKGHRYIQPKKQYYANEMNQNLSDLNIKFKMDFRLGEIKKSSKMIMMN